MMTIPQQIEINHKGGLGMIKISDIIAFLIGAALPFAVVYYISWGDIDDDLLPFFRMVSLVFSIAFPVLWRHKDE